MVTLHLTEPAEYNLTAPVARAHVLKTPGDLHTRRPTIPKCSPGTPPPTKCCCCTNSRLSPDACARGALMAPVSSATCHRWRPKNNTGAYSLIEPCKLPDFVPDFLDGQPASGSAGGCTGLSAQRSFEPAKHPGFPCGNMPPRGGRLGAPGLPPPVAAGAAIAFVSRPPQTSRV